MKTQQELFELAFDLLSDKEKLTLLHYLFGRQWELRNSNLNIAEQWVDAIDYAVKQHNPQRPSPPAASVSE